MKKENYNSKRVAFGGVLLALSVVTVFFASFLPGIELTLYALSSFYVVIAIIETGITGGWVFYGASCLLSLILIPNKLALFPYALFFGSYGIVKYYMERLKKRVPEIILKLVFFNAAWGAGFFAFREAFLGNIGLPDYPAALLAMGAQLLFLLYDAILTQLIIYYRRRFHRT